MMCSTTNVLFMCDRKKCKRCKDDCKHTSDIRYAVNGEVFKQDPLRFINMCCEPNIQVMSEDEIIHINYFELEANPNVS